jgi:hypothetical protein
VLVRVDDVASVIVNANQGIMRADEKLTAFLELQAAIHRRFEPQMESHAFSMFC